MILYSVFILIIFFREIVWIKCMERRSVHSKEIYSDDYSIFSRFIIQSYCFSESNLLLATPLSKNQVHCWSVHLNNQSHWTLWEFDITLYGYILYKQTKSFLNLLYRFFCEPLHLDRKKNFLYAWQSFRCILNAFVESYLTLSLWVFCDEYFHTRLLVIIYRASRNLYQSDDWFIHVRSRVFYYIFKLRW